MPYLKVGNRFYLGVIIGTIILIWLATSLAWFFIKFMVWLCVIAM